MFSRSLLIVMSVSTLTESNHDTGGPCPGGWHYYSGTDSCFYVSTSRVNQPTARSRCQIMGADLASISNQAEMDFVNSISNKWRQYWFGLYKETATPNGTTRWYDGNPSPYRNWARKEYYEPNERTICVRYTKYGFKDNPCNSRWFYTCKKHADSRSSTASSTLSTTTVLTTSTASKLTTTTSVLTTAAVTSPSRAVGLAVGLSVAALVLLALIVAFIVLYRRRDRLPASIQRVAVLGFLRTPASSDVDTKYPTSPPGPTYEEIDDSTVQSGFSNQYEQLKRAVSEDPSPLSAARDNGLQPTAPPLPIHSKPQKPARAAAASVPAVNAATDESSVYRDTSTTLIDNALYGEQQPPVTSSDVAGTGGDVTDLTVIDNDLYEH